MRIVSSSLTPILSSRADERYAVQLQWMRSRHVFVNPSNKAKVLLC